MSQRVAALSASLTHEKRKDRHAELETKSHCNAPVKNEAHVLIHKHIYYRPDLKV
jgi:hypothetical protein